MQTYKICLLRHGLTRANEEGLYIGRTDLPLSPRGFASLMERKEQHAYPPASRFFAPPLSRCRQTLSVLYPDCRIEDAPGLAECDFGEWEGKSASSLQNDPRFVRWLTGESREIPGGEDAGEFQRRVLGGFGRIVETLMRAGDTEAAVCAPGGVVSLLMAALALPRLDMKDWSAENGEGYWVQVTPSLWMREPVMEFLCAVP